MALHLKRLHLKHHDRCILQEDEEIFDAWDAKDLKAEPRAARKGRMTGLVEQVWLFLDTLPLPSFWSLKNKSETIVEENE